MPEKDLEAYGTVRAEWLAGAGGSYPIRATLRMLDVLVDTFGEDFTIEGATRALKTMESSAKGISKNLKEEMDEVEK